MNEAREIERARETEARERVRERAVIKMIEKFNKDAETREKNEKKQY
jgi:hypothetical protein